MDNKGTARAQPKLFMLLLGATVPGRNTEQHDVFFSIGDSIAEMVPSIQAAWPGAKLHIDAWREVRVVDGYKIDIYKREEALPSTGNQLFFLNLGGYKKDEFDEYHYKMLVVAPVEGEAIGKAKSTAFFKHTGFDGARSHIDDKYGVDVDELVKVEDILPPAIKERYRIIINPGGDVPADAIHLGYFKLSHFK
jgi:hypothetical protein